MPEEFRHVFEPLRLRHKTLTSRITFGAHTANMAEGGLPGERHIGYYRERALGGAGMIVVEPVPVHRTAVLTRGNFRHDDDAIIPAFRRLTDACREAEPGRRDDPPAVSHRPARRRRQLVRTELVAVGSAVLPRRRRQPRHERGRDRGADRGVRRGGRPGAGERLRWHRGLRRVQRPRRPVLDASGRTGEPTSGAVRSRTGCASRRRSCAGSGSAAARTSSSVWRSAPIRSRRRSRRSPSSPRSWPGTTSGG